MLIVILGVCCLWGYYCYVNRKFIKQFFSLSYYPTELVFFSLDGLHVYIFVKQLSCVPVFNRRFLFNFTSNTKLPTWTKRREKKEFSCSTHFMHNVFILLSFYNEHKFSAKIGAKASPCLFSRLNHMHII